MIKELLKLSVLVAVIVCLFLLVACSPGKKSRTSSGISLNGDQLFALEEKIGELSYALEEAQSYANMIEDSVSSLEDDLPWSEEVTDISKDVRKLQKELDKIEDAHDSIWGMVHRKQ